MLAQNLVHLESLHPLDALVKVELFRGESLISSGASTMLVPLVPPERIFRVASVNIGPQFNQLRFECCYTFRIKFPCAIAEERAFGAARSARPHAVHSPVAIAVCCAVAGQDASVSWFTFLPSDAGGYRPLDTEDERIPICYWGSSIVIRQPNDVKHTRIPQRSPRTVCCQ